MGHLSPPHTTESAGRTRDNFTAATRWDNRVSSVSDPLADLLQATAEVDRLVAIDFGRAAWRAFISHPETIRAAALGQLLPTLGWLTHAVLLGPEAPFFRFEEHRKIQVHDDPEFQARVVVHGSRGAVTLIGVVS